MTLQDKIAEAETALHNLLTGEAVVQVQDGDNIIRYQPADAGKLQAYIDNLKRQAGTGGRAHSRRVYF